MTAQAQQAGAGDWPGSSSRYLADSFCLVPHWRPAPEKIVFYAGGSAETFYT